MLNPGMILSNRYEIMEVVGAGGMSEVYKAKCHVLNRFVAVKVLKPEFSSDANFVNKFKVEAQSAAGLTHPNIVSVYDVAEDGGIHYIVMELVEGITLKEYIQQKGRLQYDEAINVAIQIAQGLEVAHNNHTIHRDIKPQNIIVSNSGAVKVTDFGIARAASSNTMTANAMGSVHYISPEQARGGFSDERSDIYSLGITLYEMVTGRVPFEGENNVAVALMHIQGEMTSPREFYQDIPTSIEKVIFKCTQKKAERRYLTAAALIADLRRVLANPNIDCAVVPPVVTNSPTVEITSEEMKAIKEGRTMVEENISDTLPDAVEKPNVKTTIPPSKFDNLFDDDEEEDVPEEEDEDEGAYIVADDDEDAVEELDPQLKKIVMIASIAIVVIIAILLFLLISKIAGFNLFSKSSSDDENEFVIESTEDDTEEEEVTEEELITMINVVGLYKTAADEELKKAGFTNYTFEEVTDADVQEGYVISQSAEEGDSLSADTALVITLSAGKATTEVPDVTGYTDEQATTMLTEAGFTVTHGYEYSDTVDKDYVISQDPEGGSEAAEGSTVKIIVSNGKETVTTTVPDIVGKKEEKAATALSDANLVGSVSYEYSDSVDEGKVISQSVTAGSEVEEGTTVGYVVSKGKETITYSVSFSGSIKNSSYDFDLSGNVTVDVSYTIGSVTYSLYSGAAGTDTFPLDISSASSVSGLSTNSGSFSVTITDTEGLDVTSSFNTSGLSATFSKE